MKPDGMRAGVSKIHELLPYFTDGELGSLPEDYGGAHAWCHYNRYPHFTKTNDLSLAVFIRYGAFTILFAGDLERAGWNSLLQRPSFIQDLQSVNVLVASHHGRDNGCCEEAFKFFIPDIVVFSDCEKKYGTQETSGWYACRTRGITDLSAPPGAFGVPSRRKVLTTRRDGTINIAVYPTGFYNIETERTLSQAGALNAIPTPGVNSDSIHFS